MKFSNMNASRLLNTEKRFDSFEKTKIVDCLQNLVSLICGSGQTEQIFVVIDESFWWRLYWNSVEQKWEVARHTYLGWDSVTKFTGSQLIPLIKKQRDDLLRANGFEHKTICRSVIYKPRISHSF